METNNLTITEALYSTATAQHNIDETNIIAAVRNAQAAVLEYTGGTIESLHALRTGDEVDNILILVTENGHRNIFFPSPAVPDDGIYDPTENL